MLFFLSRPSCSLKLRRIVRSVMATDGKNRPACNTAMDGAQAGEIA